MKDKTFTVLQVLGKGGDGEVFLVERNGVKSVIKRFTRPVLQENLDVLAALRKEGIETVEVRSVDKDANMVEFAYVEGVAVSSITHYGLDHGFNYDDMAMVRERFDAFKARYPRLRGIDDFNVFLDIKTGKFIVIDPW